jgi:hypothetical protein
VNLSEFANLGMGGWSSHGVGNGWVGFAIWQISWNWVGSLSCDHGKCCLWMVVEFYLPSRFYVQEKCVEFIWFPDSSFSWAS